MGFDTLDQRHIAHQLLIELLAHQFAYPVQWIDTQDALFRTPKDILRFVELGPAKVLTGMAKRTRDSKYAMRDRTKCLKRHFLSCTQNHKEIHYEYEAQAETPAEAATVPASSPATTEITQPAPQPPPLLDSPALNGATTSIADVPIPAGEIVRCLIAYKLKKRIDYVVPTRTIKELSGGKSTLQNEIIGDLGVEFGTTPDGAEDLTISSLGEALEIQHNGQLGKVSSAMISRFISASMPAKFNLASAREYLSSKWALGPSRQTSVLLFAMAETTASGAGRLPSALAAQALLDSSCTSYAASCSLSLEARSAVPTVSETQNPVVDAAIMERISTEHRLLASKQLQALSGYLKLDADAREDYSILEIAQKDLQKQLDLWISEFGDEFQAGIMPVFDSRKSRRYNSSWNQGHLEIMSAYYTSMNSSSLPPSTPPNVHDAKLVSIANKASKGALRILESLRDEAVPTTSPSISFIQIAQNLIPMIDASIRCGPRAVFAMALTGPRTTIAPDGSIDYEEIPRLGLSGASYTDLIRGGISSCGGVGFGRAAVLTRHGSRWEEAQSLCETMFTIIQHALDNGISLSGKHILVTGAGPGSIGGEVVKILLQAGAHVIMTTSRELAAASSLAQNLYAEHAGRDSELVILPFNQASASDCKALIDHIYNPSGLGVNLDAVIPFAALSETGIEVDAIDSRSELAHRLMLTNIFRLLGHIIRIKTEQDISCQPTQIILPLSPNHGTFGGDGLYSESKLGLESLLNRFHSESWADLVSVAGIVIGWTRGTGLMRQNDLVAETIEEYGVLTFSQQEMALNVVSLLTSPIVQICEDQPIIADFSGGLGRLEKCSEVFARAHMDINVESALRKAIYNENKLETPHRDRVKISSSVRHRSTLKMGFPPLPNHAKDLMPLSHLQDMVDLSSTVVVVGFSELGPWGNARTRWERESQGSLTQTGYLELAWLMNLIKHFDGNDSAGHYVGWVDSKTNERIHDDEVEAKYGQYILQNSGIRWIDPDLFNGYDPSNKEFLQEIMVEEDLPEFDADLATAEAFKRRHGDGVVIRYKPGEQCRVQVKGGARILVPKASIFEAGLVAGQLPKGWDAAKYGIEEDIIKQVDPVTVYVLCCVAESLLSAGISDPMEIYEHIHVSEIGNIIGSSMGGTEKTRQMYREIHLDKQVQGDVIQETYINTPSAWVNMLLLGSSGPIKTPVGACATGVEAIDIGFESIVSGKTQMCIVGGTDNFQEDESYGFSTMKATANATEELLRGRLPHEMSRPMAESRAGFVESQGCGIQILCSAELAISMGLPVYAIIAGSTMAADKISKSVPAPGAGVLTFARETAETGASPLLDIRYRRDQLQQTMAQLESSSDPSFDSLSTPGLMTPPDSDIDDATCIVIKQTSGGLRGHTALASQIKAAQRLWGNEFRRQDPQISPLRASLAVWGLSVNDVSVASLHATSTKANDKNEPSIINTQMKHLGRRGLPILAVCQKSITGHPKAPAASWMLNGCLQMLATGVVPGNQNADNVDPMLKQFDHLVFPTKAMKVHEIKAFVLTSFGFGQKGGQIVGVAPKYLFATLSRQQYEEYTAQVTERTRKADRFFAQAVISNKIFRARDKPPYTAADETKILLNPLARVSKNAGSDEYEFKGGAEPPSQPRPMLSRMTTVGTDSSDGALTPTAPSQPQRLTPDLVSKAWIEKVVGAHPAEKISVGIDVEDIDRFTYDDNSVFVNRNYTQAEQRFARQSQDPHATFVSRWCAKEAVFKSLGVKSKGAGAALIDIEIEACDGVPTVKLHGDAALAAAEQGIQDIQLSLTYSNGSVIALVLAMR